MDIWYYIYLGIVGIWLVLTINFYLFICGKYA